MLRDTLGRPERNDLGRAKILVETFRKDLEVNDLAYPIYPPEIADLMAYSTPTAAKPPKPHQGRNPQNRSVLPPRIEGTS